MVGSVLTGLAQESFCLHLLGGLQQSKSVILPQNSVQFEVSKKNEAPVSSENCQPSLSSVFQMCLGCMELHKVS